MVEYNERPSDKGNSSSGPSNAATTEVKMELLPEGNSGREGPSGWMAPRQRCVAQAERPVEITFKFPEGGEASPRPNSQLNFDVTSQSAPCPHVETSDPIRTRRTSHLTRYTLASRQ